MTQPTRLHRRMRDAHIVTHYYRFLGSEPGFSPALCAVFDAATCSAADRLHWDGGGTPPAHVSATLRHESRALASVAQVELRPWPLPEPRAARDLEYSWRLSIVGLNRGPKLCVALRLVPGLPEHDGEPRATGAEARRRGYLHSESHAFSDPGPHSAIVGSSRVALRLYLRAVKCWGWTRIAADERVGGHPDAVRHHVVTWATRIGIRLPPLKRGRPEL